MMLEIQKPLPGLILLEPMSGRYLAPVITLNGLENTTLVLGRTYIDEGTVVIDNDPNYTQTSATTSNNINNTKLRSYLTQPDSAGNETKTSYI